MAHQIAAHTAGMSVKRRNVFFKSVLFVTGSLMAMTSSARAFEIETGNPEIKINWDTQLKYSAAYRLRNQSATLTGQPNRDDGDRNFDKGVVSNRFDIFTEADMSYRGWGARVSAAGWYDTVYNNENDNNSPGRVNKKGNYNEFPHGTQELHGRRAEILDAFGFGRFDIGDSQVSFRAGRHALQYGETLFYGANGIAGGMAPIDIVKALSVPNALFKELVRPVGQVSTQITFGSDVTLGLYYQYEWQHNVFPGSGSYFSGNDIFDAGGQYFTVAGGPARGPRLDDQNAPKQGQFGAQLRFRVPGWTQGFGLYAIHYHPKSPAQPNLNPVGGLLAYQLVYAKDVTAFGVSVNDSLGSFELAAESSIRINTPLTSRPNIRPFAGWGTNSDPTWAVGQTWHANISAIYSAPPSFISNEGTIVAEVAVNQLLKVTDNPRARNFNSEHTGLALFLNYEPVYRQVMPGLDISVPMGVSYAPMGNDAAGVFGVDDGGSANIGVSFTYLDAWRANVQYTRFLGPTGPQLDGGGVAHFDQWLKDRSFVSINLRRTF